MACANRNFASDSASIRLTPAVAEAIRQDRRRILIVGASGWIGKATLAALHDVLGHDEAHRRVLCFGSQARMLSVEPDIVFSQRPLADLRTLTPEPSVLFHLAFLTKDKVGETDDAEYARANRCLSTQVLDALVPVGVDRLFVASSGAAAFADDPAAAHDLRLYGGLKREDEERFALWAKASPQARRAVIARIYNISGPYINKHQTYALASFILDALAARPIEVRAPMRVIRGYVALRELLSLIFAMVLDDGGEPVRRFDSGGEPLELGDVAARVADAMAGGAVDRRAVTDPVDNRYVGDNEGYRRLLDQFGIDHVPLAQQIRETAGYLARAG